MRKTSLMFSIALIFFYFSSNAQIDNFWAFGGSNSGRGGGTGIDFNTNPPTAVRTSIDTREGSASICDTNGKLLFYTDGTDIWDRQHNLMPNGKTITNVDTNITFSTTQGTIILPMPGSPGKYYVFSLGCCCGECGNYAGRLYYSVVDMSLNSGLGDVVATQKGIFLDSNLGEQMTAVLGDDCNIWLLVLGKDDFCKAYSLDVGGLNRTAVISPRFPGPRLYDNGSIGSMDVSADRRKLAVAQGNLLIYDLDPQSGKISNPVLLDKNAANYYYSVTFSLQGTKLYAGTTTNIVQFDLSREDSAGILLSRSLIARDNIFWPRLKRAPDGKIYCTPTYYGNSPSFLNVIHQPEAVGGRCQYQDKAFSLTGVPYLSLPNSVITASYRNVFSSRTDTVFCKDRFELRPTTAGGANFLWENGGKEPNRLVTRPGRYWLSYETRSSCMTEYRVDTFDVFFDFSVQHISTTTWDSGMCQADTLLLSPSLRDNVHYLWEDGSGNQDRKVNRSGTYWVHYQVDSLCKQYLDSFIIFYPEPGYRVAFITDTLLCEGETAQFRNTSDAPYHKFIWFADSAVNATSRDLIHTYRRPGTYTVALTGVLNERCSDTVKQTIYVDPVAAVSYTKNKDAVCRGGAVTFWPQISGHTDNVQWQMEADVFFPGTRTSQIHAFNTSGLKEIRLVASFRACPNISYLDSVRVYDPPRVYIGPDTGLCFNGPVIVLSNQYHDEEWTSYQWNTGDTGQSIKVRHPGRYTLTARTEPLGCMTIESVEIRKDCYTDLPNAFTPNGDGVNDYFFPRQLLSKKVHGFMMQVFNRWGEVVFKTTDPGGRGWDGKLNDVEQPQGVYPYRIEILLQDNRKEFYNGHVTLIR